ncbi:predicted protein [Streptomyces viridosporus ATCC 14672]|uniref:Predicted protein n=1 Tax=Streptomyces viridosporus (strain ATCC 14672 / DSM 40746 / JCM 4963 / KCTC 9882 / NRRL B-12104 / FH 1290) TaxID=566461 RepID=D5ZZU2_STRV1|nr:predicted protein [Streptomyces viridosporus ATCC 14672]
MDATVAGPFAAPAPPHVPAPVLTGVAPFRSVTLRERSRAPSRRPRGSTAAWPSYAHQRRNVRDDPCAARPGSFEKKPPWCE